MLHSIFRGLRHTHTGEASDRSLCTKETHAYRGGVSSTLERVQQIVRKRIIEVIRDDKLALGQANRTKRFRLSKWADLSHRTLALVYDDRLSVDHPMEIFGDRKSTRLNSSHSQIS